MYGLGDTRLASKKYVQATISTTALLLTDIPGITAAMMAQDITRAVWITVRSGSINVTCDGTTPTTLTGHAVSTEKIVDGYYDVSRLKIIRNGIVDAVIDITLMG